MGDNSWIRRGPRFGHKGRERRMAARSVGGKAGSTSLVERLAFYESYHGNFWNKVIHVVCIPLIVWGVLVALCKVPLLGTNLGALTTAAYCAMYTLADPASGLTWGAFVRLPGGGGARAHDLEPLGSRSLRFRVLLPGPRRAHGLREEEARPGGRVRRGDAGRAPLRLARGALLPGLQEGSAGHGGE